MTGPQASSVASLGRGAYCRLMVAWRLPFLTLLALLIAPLRMMSAHAEMAMPAASASSPVYITTAAPSEHCGGMDQPRKDQPASGVDCTIACSACPSADTRVDAHPQAVAAVPPVAAASVLLGLHPESDPPPPASPDVSIAFIPIERFRRSPMKILVTAMALVLAAAPAAAQTAPAQHQDHQQHQAGQQAQHAQHQAGQHAQHGQPQPGQHQGHDMQSGCCADRNGNGQMDAARTCRRPRMLLRTW